MKIGEHIDLMCIELPAKNQMPIQASAKNLGGILAKSGLTRLTLGWMIGTALKGKNFVLVNTKMVPTTSNTSFLKYQFLSLVSGM